MIDIFLFRMRNHSMKQPKIPSSLLIGTERGDQSSPPVLDKPKHQQIQSKGHDGQDTICLTAQAKQILYPPMTISNKEQHCQQTSVPLASTRMALAAMAPPSVSIPRDGHSTIGGTQENGGWTKEDDKLKSSQHTHFQI